MHSEKGGGDNHTGFLLIKSFNNFKKKFQVKKQTGKTFIFLLLSDERLNLYC